MNYSIFSLPDLFLTEKRGKALQILDFSHKKSRP